LRLSRVQVRNFKSIDDSAPFSIDRVTCFVGKNESGKSALLQALYKLGPVTQADANFDPLVNYPRRRWSAYKERMAKNPDLVVTTWWELDNDDIAAFAKTFGPNTLTGTTIEISKDYSNAVRYNNLPLDEKQVVARLVRESDLYEEERQPPRIPRTRLTKVSKFSLLSSNSRVRTSLN